jgi:type II secretory pathway component PulF
MSYFAFLGYKRPGLALIISPISAVLLAVVLIFIDYPEAALMTPFIFIATLIAILMAKYEPDSNLLPKEIAKGVLVSCGVLIVTVVGFVFFLPGAPFVLIIFIAFIGFIINYAGTSRYATAAYVISTIGSSMRQNLPLAMALETAASGRSDSRARILRRIHKWLVQGYSLSESIKRGYPKCPGRAVAMIKAAERIDQLPFAIRSIEADMVVKADEKKRIKTVGASYPIILIVAMFLIVLGLMTFVIPKFYDVLTEMSEGLSLPPATRILMWTARFFVHDFGWLVLVIILLTALVIWPISIRIRFRPRRPEKPYLISRILDFIKWHLPILHWFENNYSMVQVVELLRLSLNTGCTVNGAISNALGLDVNNCFKKKLRKWLARVERGDNISDSARESKLGSSLAWAFDDKVNEGNTLAILETLESFYRTNYSYRVNLARFIMGPCITIIMGATVGFVVYAIFSPMVFIIEHLSSMVMP